MGDREILEIYSNSASKNTSETDNFRHGLRSLLTSVIDRVIRNCGEAVVDFPSMSP